MKEGTPTTTHFAQQPAEIVRFMQNIASTIAAFCEHNYNAPLFKEQGQLSIVYIEGINPDYTLNNDRLDGWNDLRLIIKYQQDRPHIVFQSIATTEPGRASTMSAQSQRLGGVARIPFGFFQNKWIMGYHNYSRSGTSHPALIQRRDQVIMVHRDANRDGIRTGDPILPARGINQHGVLGKAPDNVGRHSAGCLVGKDWNEHLEFLEILKTDIRYQNNKKFYFSTWVIPGDRLLKFNVNVA